MKLNCWEFFKCGRQPEGENVPELGACLTPIFKKHEGVNGGQAGGRHCWHIAGKESGGNGTCIIAETIKNCQDCGFYQLVKSEQNGDFLS